MSKSFGPRKAYTAGQSGIGETRANLSRGQVREGLRLGGGGGAEHGKYKIGAVEAAKREQRPGSAGAVCVCVSVECTCL